MRHGVPYDILAAMADPYEFYHDLPVKTVAYLAGFPSQEHMRVTFLHQDGCSPSEYRRRIGMSQDRGMSDP